jgi:hypothetical protein
MASCAPTWARQHDGWSSARSSHGWRGASRASRTARRAQPPARAEHRTMGRLTSLPIRASRAPRPPALRAEPRAHGARPAIGRLECGARAFARDVRRTLGRTYAASRTVMRTALRTSSTTSTRVLPLERYRRATASARCRPLARPIAARRRFREPPGVHHLCARAWGPHTASAHQIRAFAPLDGGREAVGRSWPPSAPGARSIRLAF